VAKKTGSASKPDVSESKIAKMKVDDLRQQLLERGVKKVDGLKKPDLVRKLAKANRAEIRAAARTEPPKPAHGRARKPDGGRAEVEAMKADELRRRLKDQGVQGVGKMNKSELIDKLVAAYGFEKKTRPGTVVRKGAKASSAGK